MRLKLSNKLQENLDLILTERQKIVPQNIMSGVTIFGVEGALKGRVAQSKAIRLVTNGIYSVGPDKGYNSLSDVTIEVLVQNGEEVQNMPFYWLETDDDGNLWCANNYETIEYVPYSLNINGELILIQDDTDSVKYSINEDMELEVEIYG